jgi:hypothetical protein
LSARISSRIQTNREKREHIPMRYKPSALKSWIVGARRYFARMPSSLKRPLKVSAFSILPVEITWKKGLPSTLSFCRRWYISFFGLVHGVLWPVHRVSKHAIVSPIFRMVGSEPFLRRPSHIFRTVVTGQVHLISAPSTASFLISARGEGAEIYL